MRLLILLSHLAWCADPSAKHANAGDYKMSPREDDLVKELEVKVNPRYRTLLEQADAPAESKEVRFWRQAKALLKEPWDPVAGKWFYFSWSHRVIFHPGALEARENLFWKSVENGDVGILKYVIDNCYYSHKLWLIPYFQRYRLSQLPHADAKLVKALNSLHSKYIDEDLCKLLGVLFSDYPVNHHLLRDASLLVKLDRPIQYNYLVMRLVFQLLPKPGVPIKIPTKSLPIDILMVIKDLCIEFKSGFGAFFRGSLPRQHFMGTLILADRTKAESLLDFCFNSLDWEVKDFSEEFRSEEISFLEYLNDHWPSYFDAKLKDVPKALLAGLAWKRPDLIETVESKLPDDLAEIENLIPSIFSFDKTAFFNMLISKYGFNQVLNAFANRGQKAVDMVNLFYSPDVSLIVKCLPQHKEDLTVWLKILTSHLKLTDIASQAIKALISSPQYYRQQGMETIIPLILQDLDEHDQRLALDAWATSLPTIDNVTDAKAIAPSRLLGHLFNHWPKLFGEFLQKVPFLYRAAFAWRRPSLSHLIELPDQLPDVSKIIPQMLTFDKIEYLQHILRKYGHAEICEALKTRLQRYDVEVYAMLHLIAEPNLDCSLALKLLPSDPNESVYFISWMMEKTVFEPNEATMNEVFEAWEAKEDREGKLLCALFSEFKQLSLKDKQ